MVFPWTLYNLCRPIYILLHLQWEKKRETRYAFYRSTRRLWLPGFDTFLRKILNKYTQVRLVTCWIENKLFRQTSMPCISNKYGRQIPLRFFYIKRFLMNKFSYNVGSRQGILQICRKVKLGKSFLVYVSHTELQNV